MTKIYTKQQATEQALTELRRFICDLQVEAAPGLPGPYYVSENRKALYELLRPEIEAAGFNLQFEPRDLDAAHPYKVVWSDRGTLPAPKKKVVDTTRQPSIKNMNGFSLQG